MLVMFGVKHPVLQTACSIFRVGFEIPFRKTNKPCFLLGTLMLVFCNYEMMHTMIMSIMIVTKFCFKLTPHPSASI